MINHTSSDLFAHLRPALFMAYQARIPVALVGRGSHSFKLPKGSGGSFSLLADDTGVAVGPTGFDRGSLRRLLAGADTVIVHAWALEPFIYSVAVNEAVFLRRDVVVVETRRSHEKEWITMVQGLKKPRIVITTPVGGRA